jgi:hypothetical protein
MNSKKSKTPSGTSAFLNSNEIQTINRWVANMDSLIYSSPGETKKIVKDSLRLDYQKIGQGLNRVVFDLNNGYVLKVATTELGVKCNQNEYDIYTRSHPNIQKNLCPVIEKGNGWIIMKKMNISLPKVLANYYKIMELHAKFLSYGIIPVDLRAANVALSEDKVMTVIDYGLFVRVID